MDALKHANTQWFSELSPFWPGQCMSLEIEEKLEEVKSEFQEIEVYQTKNYGKMLVLDGVIQLTERDEFSYQEMISHLPLFAHKNPERVCIIGGGDGGALTEVCKHPSVKEIVLCEIDVEVINASKKYFPKFRRGFEDQRVTIFSGDGAEFLKNHEHSFDVIITDSSDPIGPASSLFESNYYRTLKNALREGGIAASQGECVWIHLPVIKQLADSCKEIFNTVEYAFVSIPTYPSGQIGVLLCSDNASHKSPSCTPEERFSAEDAQSLQYYSPAIHSSSFILPPFAEKVLALGH